MGDPEVGGEGGDKRGGGRDGDGQILTEQYRTRHSTKLVKNLLNFLQSSKGKGRLTLDS